MPRIKKDPIPSYLRNHERNCELLKIKSYDGFKVGDKVISSNYSELGTTEIITFAGVRGNPFNIRAVVRYPTQIKHGYFGNGYFTLIPTSIKKVEE